MSYVLQYGTATNGGGMSSDIRPADIDAIGDVLAIVNESSDSLDIEEAVALLRACQELGSRVRTTIGLLSQQLVQVLESPRTIDGTLYEIVNDGMWRPDHDRLRGLVKRAAAVNEDGEFRDPGAAAEEAVLTMYDLFVSPSTFPKTGGLDRLGLKKSDVGHFEEKGRKLRETKVVE